MIKTLVKKFSTQIHKEITITKNSKTHKFDIEITFEKSKGIQLFDGSCKSYQINYGSMFPSLPNLYFHADINPEITKLIIKSKFQLRTIIEDDKVVKYIFEKFGLIINNVRMFTDDI